MKKKAEPNRDSVALARAYFAYETAAAVEAQLVAVASAKTQAAYDVYDALRSSYIGPTREWSQPNPPKRSKKSK